MNRDLFSFGYRLLCRMLLAAGLAASVSAFAQTTIFMVDQVDQDLPDINPGDGVCATSNGTCTLRAAIMEANAQPATSSLYIVKIPQAADIVLTRTGQDDMAAVGELDIRKNISVTARPLFQPVPVPLPEDQRATVRNGYLGFPLFAVHPDQTLWVSDLVLSQSAGAVISKGGADDQTTIIMDHVTVSQNHGLFALAARASHVTIEDSNISDNVSTMNNQYVNCSLVAASQQLTMRRTRLVNNNAGGPSSGFGLHWLTVCAGHGPSLIEDSVMSNNLSNDPADPFSAIGSYVLTLRRTTVSGYSHAALTSRWGANTGGLMNRAGDYTLENVTFSGHGHAGVDLRAESDFYAIRIRNSTFHDHPTDIIIDPAPNYTASVFRVIGSILTSCSLPGKITRQTDYYNLSTAVTGCLVGGTNQVAPAAGLLSPLADNGGHVPTHALPQGSSAINRGPISIGGTYGCLPTDARGRLRPHDGSNEGIARCDVGAYELAGNNLFHDRFEED